MRWNESRHASLLAACRKHGMATFPAAVRVVTLKTCFCQWAQWVRKFDAWPDTAVEVISEVSLCDMHRSCGESLSAICSCIGNATSTSKPNWIQHVAFEVCCRRQIAFDPQPAGIISQRPANLRFSMSNNWDSAACGNRSATHQTELWRCLSRLEMLVRTKTTR